MPAIESKESGFIKRIKFTAFDFQCIFHEQLIKLKRGVHDICSLMITYPYNTRAHTHTQPPLACVQCDPGIERHLVINNLGKI